MMRGRLEVLDEREARLYLSPTSIKDAKRVMLLSALYAAGACELGLAHAPGTNTRAAKEPALLEVLSRMAVETDEPLFEIVFTLKDGVALDPRLMGGVALPSGLELQEGGAE